MAKGVAILKTNRNKIKNKKKRKNGDLKKIFKAANSFKNSPIASFRAKYPAPKRRVLGRPKGYIGI